jgi:hypothetical protein
MTTLARRLESRIYTRAFAMKAIRWTEKTADKVAWVLFGIIVGAVIAMSVGEFASGCNRPAPQNVQKVRIHHIDRAH